MQKRIVIVGGGAGGIELASLLARATRGKNGASEATVTLIDKYVSHLWKPRLHEVAVGLRSVAEEEVSFFSHSLQNGYQFEWGSVHALNTAGRTVSILPTLSNSGGEVLPEREIPYDILVWAIGSEPNDFGTPGAEEHCLFLNDRKDAIQIRAQLLANVLRLSRGLIPRLEVAVIGGGATGVELVADFFRSSEQVSLYGGPIDKSTMSVTIIDATDRLLAANPPEVSAYAAETLSSLGVRLKLNSRVVQVDAEGVHLQDGEKVSAKIRIWTAGIKGPSLVTKLTALRSTPHGRLIVDDHLRTNDANVYAMGDCAQWTDPDTGRPAPFTAQVASAQASYLAKALHETLAGRAPDGFRFKSAGALVALGDKTAAGNLTTRVGRRSREHFVQGVSAKLLYALLYRQHQYRLYGFFRTAAIVTADWMTRKIRPLLKLH